MIQSKKGSNRVVMEVNGAGGGDAVRYNQRRGQIEW